MRPNAAHEPQPRSVATRVPQARLRLSARCACWALALANCAHAREPTRRAFHPRGQCGARGSQSQADRGGLHCATTALRKLKMLGVAAAEACRMRARAPLRVPTNSLRSEPTDPIRCLAKFEHPRKPDRGAGSARGRRALAVAAKVKQTEVRGIGGLRPLSKPKCSVLPVTEACKGSACERARPNCVCRPRVCGLCRQPGRQWRERRCLKQ